jgi:hypothetical protein
MHIHNFWAPSATQRLEQSAAEMAESCLPWILSQVKPRISSVGPAGRKGYVRAWARLAIEGRGAAGRLQGFTQEEQSLVVAWTVERIVNEVLHKLPSRHRHSLRKAA